eukprot:m.167045 g.167045  ORF g.167045 m.167045 type:complete len:1393 (-) comp13461_c0_seq2:2048-6226(-)
MFLAQRVMGRVQLHPKMWPPIPDASTHPLWSRFNQFVIDILSGSRYLPTQSSTLETHLREVERVLTNTVVTGKIKYAPVLAQVHTVAYPPLEQISSLLEAILKLPLRVKEQFVYSSLHSLVMKRPDTIKASIYGEIVFLCIAVNPALAVPFSTGLFYGGNTSHFISSSSNAPGPETVFARLCRLAYETLPGGVDCNIGTLTNEVASAHHRIELSQDTLKATSLASILFAIGLCIVNTTDEDVGNRLALMCFLFFHHKNVFLQRAAVFLLYNIFEKLPDVVKKFCTKEVTLNELECICIKVEDVWVKALSLRILTLLLEKAPKKEKIHFKACLKVSNHCYSHPSFLVRTELAKLTYTVVVFFSFPIQKHCKETMFNTGPPKPQLRMFPLYLIHAINDSSPGVVAWMIRAYSILVEKGVFHDIFNALCDALNLANKVQQRRFHTPIAPFNPTSSDGIPRSDLDGGYDADDNDDDDEEDEEEDGYANNGRKEDDEDDDDESNFNESEEEEYDEDDDDEDFVESRLSFNPAKVRSNSKMGSSRDDNNSSPDWQGAKQGSSTSKERKSMKLSLSSSTSGFLRKKRSRQNLSDSFIGKNSFAYSDVVVQTPPSSTIVQYGNVYYLSWMLKYTDGPLKLETGVLVLDDCIYLVNKNKSKASSYKDRLDLLYNVVMDNERDNPMDLPNIPPNCMCSRCNMGWDTTGSEASSVHYEEEFGITHHSPQSAVTKTPSTTQSSNPHHELNDQEHPSNPIYDHHLQPTDVPSNAQSAISPAESGNDEHHMEGKVELREPISDDDGLYSDHTSDDYEQSWFKDSVITGHARNDFLFRAWKSWCDPNEKNNGINFTVKKVIKAYAKKKNPILPEDEMDDTTNSIIDSLRQLKENVYDVHLDWVETKNSTAGKELFYLNSEAGCRHRSHLVDLMISRLLNRHSSRAFAANKSDEEIASDRRAWTSWFYETSKILFEDQDTSAVDISCERTTYTVPLLAQDEECESDNIRKSTKKKSSEEHDLKELQNELGERQSLFFVGESDEDEDEDEDDKNEGGDEGGDTSFNIPTGEECNHVTTIPTSHSVAVTTTLGRCFVVDFSSRPTVRASFQIQFPEQHEVTDIIAYGDREQSLFAGLSTGVVVAFKHTVGSSVSSQQMNASCNNDIDKQGYELVHVVGATSRVKTSTKLCWRSKTMSLAYHYPTELKEYNFHTYASYNISNIKPDSGDSFVCVREHPVKGYLTSITANGYFKLHDIRSTGNGLNAVFDFKGTPIGMSLPAVSDYHVIEARDDGLVRLFDLRRLDGTCVSESILRNLAVGEKLTSFETQKYGQLVASTSSDGPIMVHSNSKSSKVLEGNGGDVADIAFSTRYAHLYEVERGGTITLHGKGKAHGKGTVREWSPKSLSSLLS